MGELGLFYRLAGVVFLGKSLAGGGGGQNPIEPAKLGAAILHGPDVSQFRATSTRELDAARRRAAGRTTRTISRGALTQLLGDARRMREMARAAGRIRRALGGACDNIMNAIEPYVLQMQLGRR